MSALRPGEGPDVVALLTLKHRQIEALLVEAEQGTDAEARGWAFNKAAGELMLHMAIEEAVFYPAVCRWAREVLTEPGDIVADGSHAGVKAALDAVRLLAPAEPDFAPACARLREEAVKHHRVEEAGTFRQLAASMEAAHREALGQHVADCDAALRAGATPRAAAGSAPRGGTAA